MGLLLNGKLHATSSKGAHYILAPALVGRYLIYICMYVYTYIHTYIHGCLSGGMNSTCIYVGLGCMIGERTHSRTLVGVEDSTVMLY